MSEKDKEKKEAAGADEPQSKKPEAHSKEHALKVYVDRIEDDVATIVLSEDDAVHFNLPAKYLPEGTDGGDHFQLNFKPDRESAKAVQSTAEDLLKDLLGQKS